MILKLNIFVGTGKDLWNGNEYCFVLSIRVMNSKRKAVLDPA